MFEYSHLGDLNLYLQKLQDRTMELEVLPFQVLREITDDFSEERKLGEGTFGVVYRVRFLLAQL